MVLLTGYERKSLGFSEAFQEGGPRVKIVRIPKRLEGFFAPLRGGSDRRERFRIFESLSWPWPCWGSDDP